MAYRENSSRRRSDEVRYDLKEHIGVLSTKDNGWSREVNIISWNGGTAKVDIREWDPEHVRMSKGVTLFEDEAERLTEVLAERYGFRFADKESAHRDFAKAAEADSEETDTADTAEPEYEAAAACVAESGAHMNGSAAAMA